MKKYVLIVDDKTVNRMILHKILASEYGVLEASDGEEALAIFGENRHRILAIMLDLVMPGMSGYDFLRAFSQDEDSEHIPVLVSTGQTDKDNEIEALKLGAWDFIAKPYVPEIIHFRLKNAIVRSQLTAFQELKYKAEYDVLTGIFNKDKFFEATHEMLAANPNLPFSLLRFDIDRFHLVNAYFGAAYGDRLLRHIGNMLADNKHTPLFPRTYGRIAGDIFALCIPTEDPAVIEETIHCYNEIVKSFDQSFEIVSTFGIRVIKNRNVPIDEVYDRATLAAKESKGNYLNIFTYYEDAMEKNIQMEQEIINDMTAAINEKQFVVWYQPKYDIRVNAPVGAEALVRWQHPQKGMISPAKFIPVFEHNGFISKLDYYVWEQVCRDMRRRMEEGKELYPISVNVSRVDLSNPQLVDTIEALADQYEIPHEMLNLELTESAYTDNPKKMIEVMQEFQKRGFVILMDDFGSGYSSLSVLKDIDVNILKIDMRFFSETAVEGRSKSIIASVVRMAKWLRIPVIAEGVEIKDQVEFLREIGCEYVQGYYFAKPMPLAEYLEYMESHSAGNIAAKGESSDAISQWSNDLVVANLKQAAAMFEYNGAELKIVYVNHRFYDLFGYEDQEEHFMAPLNSVEPIYHDAFLEAFDTAAATRESADFEYEKKTKDGSTMWLHIKIKYAGCMGQRKIFYSVFSDITALKQLDAEFAAYLKATEELSESGRLLVVDDVELNRAELKAMFEDSYEILEAANGAEAMKILKETQGSVDGILLDLVMPVMDGQTLMKKLKELPQYREIPIIIITANDSAAEQDAVISLGADDYIVKPFTPKVVLRRVQNALGLHRRFLTSFGKMRKAEEKSSGGKQWE